MSNSQNSALSKYCTHYKEPGKQLLILYGTEYGFSEEIARKLFDRISDNDSYRELSWQPRVLNSKDFGKVDFSKEQVLLCVFSTTGDGEWLYFTHCVVLISKASGIKAKNDKFGTVDLSIPCYRAL